MITLKPTGDSELDALFESASELVVDSTLRSRAEDTGLVSSEPVKPGGKLQNSGIGVDPYDPNSVVVPYLTEDELAANTPAKGKHLMRVKRPSGVGQQTFLTLLSNAYALYVTDGSYDNERLQRRTGLAPGIIAKTLSSPEFNTALRLRGVSPEATGFTREQELCLQVLTDPSDGRSLKQKLDSLKPHGVTYAKYRAWLKNSTFRAYVNSVTEDMLSNNHDALVQLERLAGEGDLGAIKYKLEMNGRYNPGQQQQIDLMAVLSKTLDIISRHIRDPEALQGIAQDMGHLAQELKIAPQIER